MGLLRSSGNGNDAAFPQLGSAFDAPRETLDSVDVIMEEPPALGARAAQVSLLDFGPSTKTILERAAALGPMRQTWASLPPTGDPIIGHKMQPRVAERRAKLRRVVKATLGACVALCVASLIASVSTSTDARAAPSTEGKPVASRPVTTIEKIDDGRRTKAPREVVRRVAKHR